MGKIEPEESGFNYFFSGAEVANSHKTREEFKGRDIAFVSYWLAKKDFKSWGPTDKSDDRVGHLNTILAGGGGNLNDPVVKSSNTRGLPRGRGVLNFELIGAYRQLIYFSFTICGADFRFYSNPTWFPVQSRFYNS